MNLMNRLPRLTAILAAFMLSLGATAQESCPNLFDTNDNNTVDIEDFLAILGLFADNDLDDDGVWDSQDLCTDLDACNYEAIPSEPCGYIDALGLCGGGCEGDGDGDGICDSEDDCIGVYDECGVCNGPGPTEVVIDGITILYDSVYAEQIDIWFVFEVGADTAFSYLCAGLECESPNWVQQGQKIDGNSGEQTGERVAISGDGSTIAIGSMESNVNAGHVRIYGWDGGSWVQKGQQLDGESAWDAFGHSIAFSNDGNIVAIGGAANDGNGNDSGHVRVFSWDGSTWNQIGQDIDGEMAGDDSGYSVSISADGTIVAIGAPFNDGGGIWAGHVRIFSWNEVNWMQMGEDIDIEYDDFGLPIYVTGNKPLSGYSVSLSDSGDEVAIGAPGLHQLSDDANYLPGEVRVYFWSSDGWTQKGETITGEAVGDTFGYSVSLSADGNMVAIGAQTNNTNGTSAGHVRVFNWNDIAWIQVGEDINGGGIQDQLGTSVSLSSDGSIVAIGAPGSDSPGPANSGSALIFKQEGNSWIQMGVTIHGENAGDVSGTSVSLSGDGTRLIVGAPENTGGGDHSGHAKVYDLDCQDSEE